MDNDPKVKARRQIPDAFDIGDRVDVSVSLQAIIRGKEALVNGDWLFTIEPTLLTTNTTETVEGGDGDRKVAKRVRTVLWSVSEDGRLEFVLDIGGKQLLRSLGISAKKRQSIREDLATLPASEAQQLLKELIASGGSHCEQEEVNPSSISKKGKQDG